MHQRTFDGYAAVAPVLFARTDDDLPRDDMTLRIGEALDRSDAVEDVVRKVREGITGTAEERPEFATVDVAHVIVRDEEFGAGFRSVGRSGANRPFDELGFAPRSPRASSTARTTASRPTR